MTSKEINFQTQQHNPDSHGTLELVACQITSAVGIGVGIGALPLMRERLASRFWMAEAAAGVLCIAVGLFFLERRSHRLLPFLKSLLAFLRRLPSSFKRLNTMLRSLPAFIRLAWDWIRFHLPGRRKTSPAPVSHATPPVKVSQPTAASAAAPAAASDAASPARLPYLTMWIGLFIFFPALFAASLQHFQPPDPDLIAIYFSTPALLIWVIGEVPYILPRIVVRPWDGAILTAILKSGSTGLSAVLIYVFLGLALVKAEHPGLLFAGLGLALLALVFGWISNTMERQRLRDRPPPSRQQPETIG